MGRAESDLPFKEDALAVKWKMNYIKGNEF